MSRAPTLRRKAEYQGVTEITGMSPGKESWEDTEIIGIPSIRLSVLSNNKATRMSRTPTLRRKSEYQGVTEITGMSPGKESWEDTEIIGLPSIRLSVLSNDEMDREGKIFLHGLQTKMSPRAVAAALILTWNMRSVGPVESRIFPAEDEGEDVGDINLTAFEEVGENYSGTITDAIYSSAPGFSARRATAFVAASTLKMFAKTATGWILAWDKSGIQSRYRGFTKKQFPLNELQPDKDQIDVLCEAYQGQRIFLGTLGRILFALVSVEDTRQTDMLFEQHLSCTGLHIVPLFIKAKIGIGSSTEDLLCALDMGQNTPTLVQLRNLIDNSLSKPISADNRGTWRFARLFDQSAFSLLRTKYCQDTVGILANINHISGAAKGASNPLDIAVLRQMSPDRMKRLRGVARNIYHYFTKTENSHPDLKQ